ncbi:hypothetical protein RRG08_055547 [Elysia crispata]|uniref:Uncharacterized protein n=1 Tax=Elysia crispata TaxID=231223 RepID=A0AAE1DWK7_9GAST|nr:hypothetical protein RRG08_055547 [Elysia crispata]
MVILEYLRGSPSQCQRPGRATETLGLSLMMEKLNRHLTHLAASKTSSRQSGSMSETWQGDRDTGPGQCQRLGRATETLGLSLMMEKLNRHLTHLAASKTSSRQSGSMSETWQGDRDTGSVSHDGEAQ